MRVERVVRLLGLLLGLIAGLEYAQFIIAQAGIHDHRGKRFARVFDAGSSDRAACGERSDQCECDEATDETRHSHLIAKTGAASKCFAETGTSLNDSHVSHIAHKMHLCFAPLRLIP